MLTASTSSDTRLHILLTARPIISGKGYSAVGLNEILQASGVPKGSFYHYFSSKDAFGEALLEHFFEDYLQRLQALLQAPCGTAAERLMQYWQEWLRRQVCGDPDGQCLAVKLAAEVSDLSDAMRRVLQQGTRRIIAALASAIANARAEGSLPAGALADELLATTLYQLWLGAGLRAKITRDAQPMQAAMTATHMLLGLPPNT